MLEKLCCESCWEQLKSARLPIILYGMGNGADMIIKVLEEKGLRFADVFASDGFVRGQYFHGVRVKTLTEIERTYGEFVVVMTFAVHDEKSLEAVSRLSRRHRLFSPTVPVSGGGLIDREYVRRHEPEYDSAYALLSDDESRKCFLSVLSFQLSGDVNYLFSCQSEKSAVYDELLRPGDGEHFVDLGAYNGDTVEEFCRFCKGEYKKITALEPDPKSFKKLLKNTESLDTIDCHRLAAWSERRRLFFESSNSRSSHPSSSGAPADFDAVDSVVQGKVTILKMDVEGSEAQALLGAKATIRRDRPRLYVCAYHRNEDLFALPLLIEKICPGYCFYLRHHPYIPAWETNYYCLPS